MGYWVGYSAAVDTPKITMSQQAKCQSIADLDNIVSNETNVGRSLERQSS